MKLTPLFTGDTAELEELKSGWYLLKCHHQNGCTTGRFYPTRGAAEAALAYLTTNGIMPPFPEEDENDEIPY